MKINDVYQKRMQSFPMWHIRCGSWFKFYFLLFLGMVMYDNEFETKESNIWTNDKIEPEHYSFRKKMKKETKADWRRTK